MLQVKLFTCTPTGGSRSTGTVPVYPCPHTADSPLGRQSVESSAQGGWSASADNRVSRHRRCPPQAASRQGFRRQCVIFSYKPRERHACRLRQRQHHYSLVPSLCCAACNCLIVLFNIWRAFRCRLPASASRRAMSSSTSIVGATARSSRSRPVTCGLSPRIKSASEALGLSDRNSRPRLALPAPQHGIDDCSEGLSLRHARKNLRQVLRIHRQEFRTKIPSDVIMLVTGTVYQAPTARADTQPCYLRGATSIARAPHDGSSACS